MKLMLDRGDLRPEHFFLSAVKVDFRHFTKKAMKAIIASNGALFEHGDNSLKTIKAGFPQKPIKPIGPKDIKVAPIPDEVIQVFNDLIQKHWDGKEAIVEQEKVLLAISLAMGISKDEASDRNYLNVEEIYREAGWEVVYESETHVDDLDAWFSFSKPE